MRIEALNAATGIEVALAALAKRQKLAGPVNVRNRRLYAVT